MHPDIAKFIGEGTEELPLEYVRQRQLASKAYYEEEELEDVEIEPEVDVAESTAPVSKFKYPTHQEAPKKPTITEAVRALDQVLEASPVTPVIVRTTMAKIKLPARLVSTSEYSLGFFLPSDSSAEFQVGAEFNLEFNGRVIPVMYAGGLFQLQRSSYLFMSFVITHKEDVDHVG